MSDVVEIITLIIGIISLIVNKRLLSNVIKIIIKEIKNRKRLKELAKQKRELDYIIKTRSTATHNFGITTKLPDINLDDETIIKILHDELEKKNNTANKMQYRNVNEINNKKNNTANTKVHSHGKQYSIVDEIYNKKKKQYNNAIYLLLITAMFYCCIDLFFNIKAKMEALIFIYILIGFVILSKLLASYRLKKGYYGTNYEEAKELLCYLIDDSDKNNKNTGKKIFNEIDDYNKANETAPMGEGELQY